MFAPAVVPTIRDISVSVAKCDVVANKIRVELASKMTNTRNSNNDTNRNRQSEKILKMKWKKSIIVKMEQIMRKLKITPDKRVESKLNEHSDSVPIVCYQGQGVACMTSCAAYCENTVAIGDTRAHCAAGNFDIGKLDKT